MVVGILTLRLSIGEARSLKEKRRVLKSFKDRTRNSFNVSVAEIEGHDTWTSSALAIAMIGTDRRYVNGALDAVVNAARRFPGAQLMDYEMEFL